jgi:hypothetical protein
MRDTIQAGIISGIVGAFAIDLYLIVTQSWILHVATPVEISQWDASNLLGRAAFFGGISTALLGLFMNLCVGAVWGIVFAVVMQRFGMWRVRPIVTGIVFGTIAMLVMRYAVVPLGHAHQPYVDAARLANLWAAHTLGFGIPVAITFKKLSSHLAG